MDEIVKVFYADDVPEELLGQSTKNVQKMQAFMVSMAADLGSGYGYPEAASALLGAAVNYMLSIYTVESVKDVLEGVLPNLQAMHDQIEAEWLMRAADTSNPQ